MLDHRCFPHILSAILAAATPSLLLAFRQTCKKCRDEVDAILIHHILLSPEPDTNLATITSVRGCRIPQLKPLFPGNLRYLLNDSIANATTLRDVLARVAVIDYRDISLTDYDTVDWPHGMFTPFTNAHTIRYIKQSGWGSISDRMHEQPAGVRRVVGLWDLRDDNDILDDFEPDDDDEPTDLPWTDQKWVFNVVFDPCRPPEPRLWFKPRMTRATEVVIIFSPRPNLPELDDEGAPSFDEEFSYMDDDIDETAVLKLPMLRRALFLLAADPSTKPLTIVNFESIPSSALGAVTGPMPSSKPMGHSPHHESLRVAMAMAAAAVAGTPPDKVLTGNPLGVCRSLERRDISFLSLDEYRARVGDDDFELETDMHVSG